MSRFILVLGLTFPGMLAAQEAAVPPEASGTTAPAEAAGSAQVAPESATPEAPATRARLNTSGCTQTERMAGVDAEACGTMATSELGSMVLDRADAD